MHFYISKQVSSWHAKNSYFWFIITVTWKSRFSHDAPKMCKFDALLRGKAGFLMMRQKLYIWCTIMWWSSFSHNARTGFGLVFCLTSRSTIFQLFFTEPPHPGYLSVLWDTESVLLKDTIRRSWCSNPGPLALVSKALPLSHRGPMTGFWFWFYQSLVIACVLLLSEILG